MARSRKRAYTGSKRFDPSCRNHGGCPYCERSRTHFDTRARYVADEKITEALEGEDDTDK